MLTEDDGLAGFWGSESVGTWHVSLLPIRGQNALNLRWLLIDPLVPAQTGLLRKGCHRLDQLIDLRAEQRLPIARLNLPSD